MIDKESTMSEPKILRLMTKEVIICSIKTPETPDDNYWILEDPFEIRSYMNPNNGDFNSTLVDWLQFTSEMQTKIGVCDVLTCNSPDGEVLEHYLNIVGRKKTDRSMSVSTISTKNPLDIVEKVKKAEDSEVTFDDYMEILNNNKVYH